jgi:hypothetical protein
MEVCYWALLLMPLVILHHLLNVFVQLANKSGFTKKNLVTRMCLQTLLVVRLLGDRKRNNSRREKSVFIDLMPFSITSIFFIP